MDGPATTMWISWKSFLHDLYPAFFYVHTQSEYLRQCLWIQNSLFRSQPWATCMYLSIYRGWPRITDQICIADRQCPLSTSGKNAHIPWFISFLTSACRPLYVNERRDIAGYPKACRRIPMANDWTHGEREKMIFSDDKTHKNVGADVYSSRCEEKKVSAWHRTLVYRQRVCCWTFEKKWMCLRNNGVWSNFVCA